MTIITEVNATKLSVLTASAVKLYLHTLVVIVLLQTTMASQGNFIAKANNQFGLKLFNIVGKEDVNQFTSPFSLHMVLSMAYQGSDGKTAESLANICQFQDAETTADEYHKIMDNLKQVTSVVLNVANKICVKKDFKLKPSFKSTLEKKYLSDAEETDFSNPEKAAAEINNWVDKKTNSKIKELISKDMITEDTKLVLLNAVYFKGNWAKKFNSSLTKKKPFYLLNGQEIQVDMMHMHSKFWYQENSNWDCKILKLPYEGNDINMYIMLPNERNGITQLQEKVSQSDIAENLKHMGQFTVDVALPKFKIESTIPLNDALKSMGAENMFSDAANFSKMADVPLKVSDVIQKTFIEVNEEGSEAAAATGMVMMCRSMPRPLLEVEFVADHPFIFSIISRSSDNVLFIGKVMNPL